MKWVILIGGKILNLVHQSKPSITYQSKNAFFIGRFEKMNPDEILSILRVVPDFPKKGIQFYDISTLISNPEGLKSTVENFRQYYQNEKIDYICGLESRGFIFGAALAVALNVGFVMIRKPGKLPYKTIYAEYDKEYGKDKFEVNIDAFKEGNRVLIVDDLIATGGSVTAAIDLIHQLKAVAIGCACVIELVELKGEDRLKSKGCPLYSIVKV
jgi:adenine phosphoribosyltransferase